MTPLEVINPGTISQQTQNVAPSVRAPGACVHRYEQREANESVVPGRTQYASHGSAPQRRDVRANIATHAGSACPET
jgi:hypothetical protein